MAFPEDLLSVQIVREATPGVDLPTTAKFVVEQFNATPSSPEAYRPKLARGLMLANRGGETVIQRGSNISMEGPLTYEFAPHLFNGVIANVAAPTALVSTHTRNPAVMPTLASFTIERRITDLATPIDHAWHYAMFSDLTLTFNTNEVWMYQANLFARRVQTETLTPAISLPTHEIALTPKTSVSLDSTWATLGTTGVVGQVLSGSIKFGSGAAPIWTADGRADLDWLQPVYSSDLVTCEVSLTVLAGAAFATEKTAAEAQTLRAVRVQIDGSSAARQIQMDMLLKHRVPELFSFEVDQGQFIYQLDLVGSTDGTNAFLAKVTQPNAAFP